MRRPDFVLIALLGLLAGCGKTATAPPPSGGGASSPILIATQPPARSESAPYDSEIWAQFDRALDGRTVNAQTVFLKLDGQRVPSAITYEGITRRVVVKPTVVLALQRTYTVEISTAVHAVDGTPMPPGLFFQFTTNSLRRVVYDYPVAGVLEGPVVTFGWGGTQGPTNNITYEVYAGTDSLAVSARATPFLQRSVFTRFVPSARWPQGQRVFWAITAENLTTHEREHGAVQSFQVIDTSAPLDSVTILAADFGSVDTRQRITTQFCNSQNWPCGPNCNAAVHWNYAPLGPGAMIESVRMRVVMQDSSAGRYSYKQPSVWMSQNNWTPCTVISPGPPFNEVSGFLSGSDSTSTTEISFRGTRLAAFLEAQYRGRTLLTGVVLRSLENVFFHSPLVGDPARVPNIVIRFYRPPAAARP